MSEHARGQNDEAQRLAAAVREAEASDAVLAWLDHVLSDPDDVPQPRAAAVSLAGRRTA